MDNKNLQLPSLNALKAFESASRHLNFKLAADELHVTQSAIAQQVRHLEDHLQALLFERHSKGVNLTAQGQRYASQIQHAFRMMIDATQSFHQPSTEITLSVPPTFAAKWLIPRLGDFSQKYPEINLNILATDRISHFQHDHVDMTIRYAAPPFESALNVECLVQDQVIVVADPKLFQADLQGFSINQLTGFTLIHDVNYSWFDFFESMDVIYKAEHYKHLSFNQTLLAIHAASLGQGLCLTHPMYVETELKQGNLIQLFPSDYLLDKGFYLISPRRPQKQDVLQCLRHWLFEQMNISVQI